MKTFLALVLCSTLLNLAQASEADWSLHQEFTPQVEDRLFNWILPFLSGKNQQKLDDAKAYIAKHQLTDSVNLIGARRGAPSTMIYLRDSNGKFSTTISYSKPMEVVGCEWDGKNHGLHLLRIDIKGTFRFDPTAKEILWSHDEDKKRLEITVTVVPFCTGKPRGGTVSGG